MSAATKHKLMFSCDGGTDRVEDVRFYLDQTLVERGLVRFSRLSEGSFTWYKQYDDMAALSVKFPQTLFTLELFYDGDHWREYWKGGLVHRVTGFVQYAPFEPKDLHEP